MGERKRQSPARRAPSRGRRAGRRELRLNLSKAQAILAGVICLALLGGTFGLGWFFGVKSTEFHGSVLLVNDSHRLDANYVPEGLVNLYNQRHSYHRRRTLRGGGH